MKVLSGIDKKKASEYMLIAAEEAKKSPCFRSLCGCIIVNKNKIIGKGYNGPPLGKPLEKCIKNDLPLNFPSDKNCCMHAEERAIIEAFKHNAPLVQDAKLYFTRVDNQGKIQFSGKPFCTICSKMALDAGIKEFLLWHEDGITSYETDEYNTLSFQFKPSEQ
jgi:deoxycytidylate deaminase